MQVVEGFHFVEAPVGYFGWDGELTTGGCGDRVKIR